MKAPGHRAGFPQRYQIKVLRECVIVPGDSVLTFGFSKSPYDFWNRRRSLCNELLC